MNTEKSWENEKKEIYASDLPFAQRNALLETRYMERVTALSDTKISFLNQAKHLAVKEMGIDPQAFIKDMCLILCKETLYGEADVEIQVDLKDVSEWLLLVEEKIEGQKNTLQQGEEYDIPSFEEYLLSFENGRTYDVIYEEESDRNLRIAESFFDYDSDELINFLEENKIELVQEIEDEGLLFSSYNMNYVVHPAINFLMITPEDWNSDLSLGGTFVQTFMDCVQGAALPTEEEVKQTSLGQLLYQQGYTFADLVQTEAVPSPDNKVVFAKKSLFLDSLRDELFEISNSNGGVLALCGTMDIDDLYTALKNPDSQLVFDQHTTLGVFDPQQGGGSCLSVSLENPAVLPTKDCTFAIENTGVVPHRFFTIDEVFGMSGSVWRNKVCTYSPESPSEILEESAKKQPKMK